MQQQSTRGLQDDGGVWGKRLDTTEARLQDMSLEEQDWHIQAHIEPHDLSLQRDDPSMHTQDGYMHVVTPPVITVDAAAVENDPDSVSSEDVQLLGDGEKEGGNGGEKEGWNEGEKEGGNGGEKKGLNQGEKEGGRNEGERNGETGDNERRKCSNKEGGGDEERGNQNGRQLRGELSGTVTLRCLGV